MDWRANRNRERLWLEEVREERLAAVRTEEDALRFHAEFGSRLTDPEIVYALRREAWKDRRREQRKG